MGSSPVFVPPLPMSGEIEFVRSSTIHSSRETLTSFAHMLYVRCQIQQYLGNRFSPALKEVMLANQDYVEMMARIGVFLAKCEKMSVDSLKNVVSFYYRQSLFYQQKHGITQ